VDNARLAYAHFQENSRSDRWAKLARVGAQPQRPLWASTGTKNPIYSDTRYVDNLIGSDTVNTVPPATLDAFMDHGRTDRSIEEDVGGAQGRIDSLGTEGVDFDEITDALLSEGVDAFAQAFDDLMQSIEEKRNRVLEGAA
jgi:transaldolase